MSLKPKTYNLKPAQGISIVEVVIIIFVATTLLFSMAQLSVFAQRVSTEKRLELQAVYYIDEGFEALRTMRDESWSARIAPLSSSSAYYIVPAGGAWSLTTTDPGVLDGIYARTVSSTAVYRDAVTDDIVASGGVIDPDARKFTVSVAWSVPSGAKTITNDIYLTNLWKN